MSPDLGCWHHSETLSTLGFTNYRRCGSDWRPLSAVLSSLRPSWTTFCPTSKEGEKKLEDLYFCYFLNTNKINKVLEGQKRQRSVSPPWWFWTLLHHLKRAVTTELHDTQHKKRTAGPLITSINWLSIELGTFVYRGVDMATDTEDNGSGRVELNI